MARRTQVTFDSAGNTASNDAVGTDGNPITIIDPSEIDGGTGAGDDDGAPFGRFPDGRPRKRRAGGTRKARGSGKAASALDIKSLEGILLNIHTTLAALTRTPEFALEEHEAEQLARSLAQVSRHYNVPAVAPYIMDHVNLAIALVAIYGPRIAAVKIRTARETEPKPATEGKLMQWPVPVTSSPQ